MGERTTVEGTLFDRTLLDRTMFDRTMFADTLDSSWADRTRRGWTTLTSFGLQALVTGMLLLLPLLRPMGLPSFRQLPTPISLGQPLAEAPTARARASSNPAPTNPAEVIFRRPSSLPTSVPASDEGPPQITGSGPYVSGPTVSGDLRGIRGLFDGGSRPVLPAAPPVTVAHPLRLSHMSEGDLLRKVQPTYPALARSARIQGIVVLQAVISKQGTIENLRVRPSHAGARGNRCGAPVALQALHLEQRADRGGNPDHRELRARRRLMRECTSQCSLPNTLKEEIERE